MERPPDVPDPAAYDVTLAEVPRAVRTVVTAHLFAEAATGSESERARALDRVVLVNGCVARGIARRFRHRGLPTEDLEQVAYLALVRAAHRFDATRGHDFLAYAAPTITGAVRHEFRDRGWTIRMPRRLQEQAAPRVGGVTPDGLPGAALTPPMSLDQVTESADRLGVDREWEDAADARIMLTRALAALSREEQLLLRMRYAEDRTQAQIADVLGVSQMQVSRLLGRLLRRLRDAVSPPVPGPPPETRPPAPSERGPGRGRVADGPGGRARVGSRVGAASASRAP